MKINFILFLFLCSVSAFGQSKNKVNEELHLLLEKKVKTHDSLVWVLGKTDEQLQKHLVALPKFIENLENYKEEEKKYRKEIASYQEKVREVGGNPETVVSTQKLDSLKAPICEIDQIKHERVMNTRLKSVVVERQSDLGNLKISEQNQILQRKIGEYDSVFALNMNQLNLGKKSIKEWGELRGAIMRCEENNGAYLNELSNLNIALSQEYFQLKFAAFDKEIERQKNEKEKSNNKIESTRVSTEGKEDISPEPEPILLDVIEESAEFPGGQAALVNYLKTNLKLPEKVTSGEIVGGKVYLKFVVRANGELTDIKVTRGLYDCTECDEEAVRVVKAMPNWIPGKNDGKPVNTWFNLPINFKMP